jgi:two-component system sensor histidine kinase UhpB
MGVDDPGIGVETKQATRSRSVPRAHRPRTDAPSRGPRPAWQKFLAVSILMEALYFVLPGGSVAQGAVLTAIGLASTVAVVAGVRMHRPSSRRLVWHLLAAGLGVYTAALLLWFPIGVNIHLPFPSVADVLFLSSYVLLAAGLGLLAVERSQGRDVGTLLDSAVITLGLGALLWVALIEPNARTALDVSGRVVSVSYPLMDFLMLAVLVGLWFASPAERTPAVRLLSAGVLAQLGADSSYLFQLLHATWRLGGIEDLGWMLLLSFVGVAALHPSMREAAGASTTPSPRRPVHPNRRVAALAVTAAVPLVLLVLEATRNGKELARSGFGDVYLLAGLALALFVLVLLRVRSLMHDVSHHQEVVRVLHAQAVRLRDQADLLDLAREAILVRSVDGEIQFWNRGAEALYGWTREEALGRVVGKLLHSEFDRPVEEIEDAALQDGSWEGEIVQRTRDGRRLYVESRWTVRRDGSGRPVGVLGINLDITERKRTEEALRRAESQYRTLVEDIPGVVYTAEPGADGRWSYVSPRIRDLLGYTEEEWLADPTLWFERIHEGDRERVLQDEQAATPTDGVTSIEYRIRRKDGELVWVRDEARLLPRADDPDARPVFQGILHDVSEQKRAQTALHQVEVERTRLLDRMIEVAEEERGRIAAELHDGPVQHLTALDFRLERVRLGLDAPDLSERREMIEQVQGRLRAEVGDLRRLISELRPPVLDERGLEPALRDHLVAIERHSGLRCEMDTVMDERLDPELETVLYRVAQEALTNVVKHANATEARVSLQAMDGVVVLEVLDDGTGFDPRSVPMSNDGHFGLVGMRERVHAAGGDWAVVSRPGHGTRVRASLPRTRRGP